MSALLMKPLAGAAAIVLALSLGACGAEENSAADEPESTTSVQEESASMTEGTGGEDSAALAEAVDTAVNSPDRFERDKALDEARGTYLALLDAETTVGRRGMLVHAGCRGRAVNVAAVGGQAEIPMHVTVQHYVWGALLKHRLQIAGIGQRFTPAAGAG